jgi:hypothetical protein
VGHGPVVANVAARVDHDVVEHGDLDLVVGGALVSTPVYLAATAGSAPLAAQVNQLLGTHAMTPLYAGVQQAAGASTTTTATAGNGTWLAQSFTTGAAQTAIGYVLTTFNSQNTSGSNLAPATLALYANSGGAPSGSALASVTVSTEYAYSASGGGTSPNYILTPLPVTGLSPSTTYWLVAPAVGGSTYHYHWYRSSAASGASTSTNGTSWSAQAYGFCYQVYDQTASGLLTAVWQDAGARWSAYTYTSAGQIATYAEYTAGQAAGSYVQSYRTASYSGGLLTGVT